MKTPEFKVRLEEFDAVSSIARVEINSRERELLASVLAAVKRHWGKRRMNRAIAAELNR